MVYHLSVVFPHFMFSCSILLIKAFMSTTVKPLRRGHSRVLRRNKKIKKKYFIATFDVTAVFWKALVCLSCRLVSNFGRFEGSHVLRIARFVTN
jgi:hypothetical protein